MQLSNHSYAFFRNYILALFVFGASSLSGLYAQGTTGDSVKVKTTDTIQAGYIAPGDNVITATPLQPNDTLSSLKDFDSTVLDSSARARIKKGGKHSPLKAALFSAALPGLGQAYNKRYWKIPIVYAGFAGLGYALYYTSTNFHGYKNAYRAQSANPPNTNASYGGVSDPASLKDQRDYFKKYLDISAIGVTVWYLLTMVDAVVDAHLQSWNMKDDISISWHPGAAPASIQNYYATAGVTFAVNF